MSHANAILTAKGRLRLARCIVEDNWPVAPAAERCDCAGCSRGTFMFACVFAGRRSSSLLGFVNLHRRRFAYFQSVFGNFCKSQRRRFLGQFGLLLQLSGPLLRICDPAPWLLEESDARFAVNASTLRGVLQVGSGKERLGGRDTIKMVDDQDVVRIVGLRCTDSLVTPPSFCMSATES